MSIFCSKRKVPLPRDMHEKDKENLGFYRSIHWTGPPNRIPVFPDWHDMRHVTFHKLRDDGMGGLGPEDVWTDFHRQKHQVNACFSHPIGTLPSAVPEFKRNGHKRNLPQEPPVSMFLHPYFPWPKRDANIPPARLPRGDYYHFYHDAFHSNRLLHHRLLPFPQRILPKEIPRVTELLPGCKNHLADLETGLGSGLSPFNGYP